MPSFGERLKREREKRNISLEDVSASTKISTRMLHAIEDDHFDLLPGGIFNKGFVRAYARHLGLDEDETVADYLEAAGESAPKPPSQNEVSPLQLHEQNPPQTEVAAHIPWGSLALVLLIVAIGLTGWGFYSRNKGMSDQNDAASDQEQISPATSSAPAVTPVASPSPDGIVPASPAKAFTVRIKAIGDSWVSVSADGKPVLKETLVPPDQRTVQAESRLTIRTGNAGGVQFFFSNKALPPQGEEGEVREIVFDSNGVRSNVKHSPTPVSQPIR